MDIRTALMSGDWQKGNEAKYGFVPTSLSVVEMEMKLIDYSQLSRGADLNICDFTGGEGDQLHAMYQFLSGIGLNPHAYYNEITSQRYETAAERYGKLPNFHLLNTDFFYLRCKYKNGRSYKDSNFAIIRNNPPYMNMEKGGKSIRSEDLFFCDNSKYNVPGGIHIFEIRRGQLVGQEQLLRKICFRYENVQCFKFPKEEYKAFQQIVLIGVKKAMNSYDADKADRMKALLEVGQIPYLDEVKQPVIILTDKALRNAQEINMFRDGRVNDETLTNGLDQVLAGLLRTEKYNDPIRQRVQRLDDKPIIERLIGHRALELTAGKFNGVQGGVLVEGGSHKVIETQVEDEGDKMVTTEVEVIKPYIEITNATGDIIFKDC